MNGRRFVDKLLEKIWDFVAKDRSLTLPSRLFRLLCLSAAVVSLIFALPANMLEPGMPGLSNVGMDEGWVSDNSMSTSLSSRSPSRKRLRNF